MAKLSPLSLCLRCTRCSTCAASRSSIPQAVRFYNNSPRSRRPLDQDQQAPSRQPVQSWQPLRPPQQQAQRPQQQSSQPWQQRQGQGQGQQYQQQQYQRPQQSQQSSFPQRNPRLLRPSQPRRAAVDPDKQLLPEDKPVYIADPRDRLLDEYTLDEQIRSTHVLVKDVATNKLLDVQLLSRLLGSIDRTTYTIRQLSRPSIDTSQLGPGEHDPEPAIVEVTRKDELRERTLAKQKLVVAAQKAQRESKPKQIELNWAIGEHDLEIKLKQLQGFLEKGRTVEILLASKKRQRRATPDEAKNVVRAIEAKLADVGAKQLKQMEGNVGGQALMLVKKGPIPPGQ